MFSSPNSHPTSLPPVPVLQKPGCVTHRGRHAPACLGEQPGLVGAAPPETLPESVRTESAGRPRTRTPSLAAWTFHLPTGLRRNKGTFAKGVGKGTRDLRRRKVARIAGKTRHEIKSSRCEDQTFWTRYPLSHSPPWVCWCRFNRKNTLYMLRGALGGKPQTRLRLFRDMEGGEGLLGTDWSMERWWLLVAQRPSVHAQRY